MLRSWLFGFVALASVALALGWQRSSPKPPAVGAVLPVLAPAGVERPVSIPLSFEENGGQVDREVRYLAKAPGATTFLTDTGPVFGLRDGSSFRLRVRGARAGAPWVPELPLEGVVSYFIGDDPAEWHPGLKTFGAVRQRDVVPGVDLVFHGSERQLEFDLDCAADVDPSTLTLEYEGVDALALTDEGDLQVTVNGRELVQLRPKVWQVVDGVRREVDSSYDVVAAHRVAFHLGARARSARVVIDPVLLFATYLGGNVNDYPEAVAYVPDGGLYIAGWTTSTNFPLTNSLAGVDGGSPQLFVTRLSPATGTALYLAYIGGNGSTEGHAIGVEKATGNAVVVGHSSATNWPKVAAAQAANAGGTDLVISKLNATGTGFIYSTYLGATGGEQAGDVVVDSAGAAYVGGSATGIGLPLTTSAWYTSGASNRYALVAKLTSAGGLSYCTPVGACTGVNLVSGLAVDGAGNAYAVGTTSGTCTLPTNASMAGFKHGPQGGVDDAIAFKLDPTGANLLFSAQFGGANLETGDAIALDGTGVYLGGEAGAGFNALLNAAQPTYAANYDGYLIKLSLDGNTLQFGTYLGGAANDYPKSIVFDPAGNVVVVGDSNSVTGFPIKNQLGLTGPENAWVYGLTSDGANILYSFPLRASASGDHAASMNPLGQLAVAGLTSSQSAPLVNPVQAAFDGGFFDGYVKIIDLYAPHVLTIAPVVDTTSGGAVAAMSVWGFTAGTTLTVGGAPMTGLTALADGGYTAVYPAHAAGTFDLVISNPGGATDTLVGAITYIPPPQVTSIVPNHGPASFTTPVQVVGSNFTAGSTVRIGGVDAGTTVFVDSAHLNATAPARPAGGTFDVTVTNVTGITATLPAGFTYDLPPTVTAVSPAYGPSAGGTTVTVTGTHFTPGATVTIGGVVATGVVVQNSTTLTAVTGAHPQSSVDETILVKLVDNQQNAAPLPALFRYWDAPVVTSVVPAFGTASGGTSLTITGSNFRPGMAVALGGVAMTGLSLPGTDLKTAYTSATAVTGTHDAGAVDVIATNVDGQSGRRDAGYRYVEQPVVTSITPGIGRVTGGTAVVVSGAGFAAGATVTFGGQAATGLAVSATSIQATTPVHASGNVDVVVTNPPGVSGTLVSGYKYRDAPVVASVTPSAGPSAGGTSVDVAGLNFAADAGVTIGGIPVASVTLKNATTLTVATPAHPGGPADVIVTVEGVSGTLPGGYTYTSGPVLTSINPSQGPTTGGTVLSLVGGNFASGATVTLGGVSATGVALIDAGVLTATTPAHPLGRVDVVVTNPDTQAATLAQAYTYVLPAATVSSVFPTTGPSGGGTTVTVTGSNFDAQATVQFGGVQSPSVTFNSSTSLTVQTPAHVGGLVDVVVTVQGVPATKTAAFTYVPAPSISRIDPTEGTPLGGTALTVTGADFAPGARLTLGGVDATSVAVTQDGGVLTALSPAHAAGLVDVVVTNLDTQSGTRPQGFTFVVPPPAIGSVAPVSGLARGGTSVTITGANFDAQAAVQFGGVQTASVTFLSSTSLLAVTPKHQGGLVDVVVTVQGVPATKAQAFTFLPGPTITRVDPADGTVQGGTVVTLAGSDFAAGARVSLGGVDATSVTVTQDGGVLTATTPAHLAGHVDVVVTNPDTQDFTLPQAFTFVVPTPKVTAIAPASGLSIGGTPVIIIGDNFDSQATVQIGGTAATEVAYVSPTTMSAKAPPHQEAGPVDVVVKVKGVPGVLTQGFKYIGGPKLTRIDPAQGPLAGGTLLTLTGTNFQSGATVTLDGVASPTVTFVSATEVKALTPPHEAGRVDVVITNPDTQPDRLVAAFEYADPNAGLVARSRYVFGCSSVPAEWAWAAVVVAGLLRRRVRRR